MTELGYTGRSVESLVLEREQTVAALRSVCADHGDNDWTEELHLADVVDNHLGRYLDDREEG
jgi:hypothetical protein